MDTLGDYLNSNPPTADRPLRGASVLLVEDSRFASDAFRLMCMRSGARMRRADSLAAARRHLRAYRPVIALIDLGLPDGDGCDLIAELNHTAPQQIKLIAISGTPDRRDAALKAGADGFIAKPILRLAEFQAAVLAHLPFSKQPPGPRPADPSKVTPEPLALKEDLAHAAQQLRRGMAMADIPYLQGFLQGLGAASNDVEMLSTIKAMGSDPDPTAIAALAQLAQDRAGQIADGSHSHK